MLAQLITSLMYVDLPVAHRRAIKRPQTTIPVCIGHKQTITFGLGWAADTSVPNSPAETVTTTPIDENEFLRVRSVDQEQRVLTPTVQVQTRTDSRTRPLAPEPGFSPSLITPSAAQKKQGGRVPSR